MLTAKRVESCFGCKRELYAHQRLCLNDQVFHPGCAKCSVCSKNLTLQDFAVGGDVWFCKPHYKESFARSGGKYPGQGTITKKKPTWKETLQMMAEESAKNNPPTPAVKAPQPMPSSSLTKNATTSTQTNRQTQTTVSIKAAPVSTARVPLVKQGTVTAPTRMDHSPSGRIPATVPCTAKSSPAPVRSSSPQPVQPVSSVSTDSVPTMVTTKIQDLITRAKLYVEDMLKELKQRVESLRSEYADWVKLQLDEIQKRLSNIQSLDFYLDLKARLDSIKETLAGSTNTGSKQSTVSKTVQPSVATKAVIPKALPPGVFPGLKPGENMSSWKTPSATGNRIVITRTSTVPKPANSKGPSWAYVASSAC